MSKKLIIGFLSLFAVISLKAQKPNIIFIFADDWGYGDLSLHGHEHITTPNLDQLANEGTNFTQFNVNNPVCSPSRTAIMTGHYPARYSIHQHFASPEMNREREMPDWLDPLAPMLPRELKNAGYKTAHYGKWHLTNTGVYDPPLPVEYGYDDTKVFNGPGPQVGVPTGVSTGACVDYSIEFIQNAGDAPFFINLWIHESHTRIDPPEDAKEAYAHIEEPFRSYYACISYADRELGRLFRFLRDENLMESTLVIFSSDNGPESPSTNPDAITYYSRGETAGLRGQKRSLHEGGVGVPFIAHWPGKVPAGEVNDVTNISGVDMFPTLLSIAGVDLPQGYEPDGEDMSEALFGEPVQRSKPLYWEWRGTAGGENWPRLSIRKGDWKLLTNYEGTVQRLYNIRANRIEENDSSSYYIELVNELFQDLLDWKATLPAEPDPNCIQKIPESTIVSYNDFYYEQFIPWISTQALTFSDKEMNPLPDEVNPNGWVGKVIRGEGKHANILFQFRETLDLSEHNIFKVKVYFESESPPPSNCNVRLILRNNGLGATQYALTQPVVVSNQWVEYSFDCSAADGRDDYNQVLLFFTSPDNIGNSEGQIFYVDDLMGPPTDLGAYPDEVYTNIQGDQVILDLSGSFSDLELVSECEFRLFWGDDDTELLVTDVTNDLENICLHISPPILIDTSRPLVLTYLSGTIQDIDGKILPPFNEVLVTQNTPPPVNLKFVVTDSSSGNYISDAVIDINAQSKNTNTAGEAAFLLPIETYNYIISASGYFSFQSEINLFSDTIVNISLAHSVANIKFLISDGVQAVYDAEISLNDDMKFTSSLGMAVFNDIPVNQNYPYQVSKESYTTLNDEIFLTQDTTVDLTLQVVSDIKNNTNNRLNIIQDRTNGTLILECEEIIKSIELFNITGMKTRTMFLSGNNSHIDLRGTIEGIYIIRLSTDKEVFTKKIVIR